MWAFTHKNGVSGSKYYILDSLSSMIPLLIHSKKRWTSKLTYLTPTQTKSNMYTDASNMHSSCFIAQIASEDWTNNITNNDMSHLGSVPTDSVMLRNVRLTWKGSLCYYDIFRKFNYLLVGITYLHIDHKNLIRTFNPEECKEHSSAL